MKYPLLHNFIIFDIYLNTIICQKSFLFREKCLQNGRNADGYIPALKCEAIPK